MLRCFWSVCLGCCCARAVVLAALIGRFVKSEDVFVGSHVLEVDYGSRVDGEAEIACLEVEVRPGGAAGVAAQGYGLSGADALVGLDKKFREVTIDGLHAVVMAHDHIVAVAFAFIFGQTDLPAEG